MEAANQLHLPGLSPGVIGDTTTIANAITQLLAAKTAGNRRSVYLKNLEYYLNRFASGREETPLADFTTANVEDWLKPFVSAYTRQTWLNRIGTLFAFALRREIITRNPCTKIERVTVDRLPPKILTPAQVEKLLSVVSPTVRPYLILAMFAGIRPDEVRKMDWSLIDLETATARVNEAKTRRRRLVPLQPRAVALLRACEIKAGPVAPAMTTIRRFKRDARLAMAWQVWPKDVLRHTAASYLLALIGDVGKVAMMLGNSPAVLMTHYHEPVTKEACGEFWKI